MGHSRIHRLISVGLLAALAGVAALLVGAPAGGAPEVADAHEIRVQQEADAAAAPFRTVTLLPGWNLVAWTGASTVAEATASIAGDFSALYTFDAATKEFRLFGGPDSPIFLNTLDEVQLGDGVWIFVEEETVWLQPQPRGGRSVGLLTGFNLVSWTGADGTPIAEALTSIAEFLTVSFTYDAAGQSFLSYGPTRPSFLNDAITLNYGDGIWLDVTQPVTWEQPALQEVHVQDVWFFRKITRRDSTGAEMDFLPSLLTQLDPTLGPVVELTFGMTFQESALISGRAIDGNEVEIPSIGITFGVAANGFRIRGVVASSPLEPLLFSESDRVFVGFGTPKIDQARVNFGPNDLVEIDLGAIAGLNPGDTLIAEIVLAQLLPPDDPRVEDGLSPVQVFQRRWTVGAVQLTSVEDANGNVAFGVFQDVEISIEGAAAAEAAQLRASGSSTGMTRGVFAGKLVKGATVGLIAGLLAIETGPAAPLIGLLVGIIAFEGQPLANIV